MEKFLDHPRAPFKTNHRQIERLFSSYLLLFFTWQKIKVKTFLWLTVISSIKSCHIFFFLFRKVKKGERGEKT